MDHARRTQQSYDLIAQWYLARNGDRTVLNPWFDRFRALLEPGARVLDLGAGPCSDTAELAVRGLQVAALDRSPQMLRLGAERFAGVRVRGDLRRLPLATASCAGVWASASLLHLQRAELPGALHEVRRVLTDGGIFYLSLKRGDGERWEPTPLDPPVDRWFTYYREDALDAALHTAGFDLVHAQTEEGIKPDGKRETWLVRIARAR